MIDIKAIYVTLISMAIMAFVAVVNFRNLTKFKTKFWDFILGINTCVVAGVFIYILALAYEYINETETFMEKYGAFDEYIMFMGYYYLISQVAIYILIFLKKISIRKFRI